MSQSKLPPEQPSILSALINVKPMALGAEVGCLTLIIVFVSLFAGLWLDRIFDTKPVFTILLLLGSAPFALVLTFWLAMRTAKTMTQPEKKKKEESISE